MYIYIYIHTYIHTFAHDCTHALTQNRVSERWIKVQILADATSFCETIGGGDRHDFAPREECSGEWKVVIKLLDFRFRLVCSR